MSSRRFLVVLLAAVFVIGVVGSAGAVSSYLSSFSSTYPGSATASFSCQICHVPAGPPNRNSYGAAYAAAGHNFKTIEAQDSDGDGATNIAEINAGTNPGDPASKPVVAPAACTGYTYSAWSACGANGQQTRTVTANTPAGCTGTPSTPTVLTQACTPPPVACTGYTYSAWSACGANGQQTRTAAANTPAGCTGTPSSPAVLTQACTPTTVACTGYTYSAWSACGTNGQQTRTVTGSTPSGCTGTPSVSAALTQACTLTSPGMPMMPMPSSQMMFLYDPAIDPVMGSGPQDTMPIGVGTVATGGNMLTIHAEVGQFQMPMDMYFALYAPLIDPFNVYLLNQDGSLQPASMGMSPWITGVTSIDEMPFGPDIPTSMLAKGTYYLGLIATPAGSDMTTYYFWMTNFMIQ